MSYLVSGNNPAAIKTAERNIFTATASQTTFTITQGYQAGDIDVYLNGVRLVDTEDYVANNGSTVVLNSGATVGDSIVVVCFRPFQVADFYTKSEQDTRYVNATGDTVGILQIQNPTETGYASTLAESVTKSTVAVKTHSTDSTLTTFGAITGGDGYIQRSNGPGTGSYNLRLNPFGGAVLSPNQTAFYARRTAGHLSAFTGTIVFDSVRFNIGNNYNSATGVFTATISGVYAFSWSALPYSTGWCEVELRKNGSEIGGRIQNRDSGSAGDGLASKTTFVQMNAGDYVEAYAMNTYTYANDGLWTTFAGYLLG